MIIGPFPAACMHTYAERTVLYSVDIWSLWGEIVGCKDITGRWMLYQQAAAVQPGQQLAESPASPLQPASAPGSLQHWQQCCSWAAGHLLPLGTRALVGERHLFLS